MRLSIRKQNGTVEYLDSNKITYDFKDNIFRVYDDMYMYVHEDNLPNVLIKNIKEILKYELVDSRYKEIKIDLMNLGYRLVRHDDTYIQKTIIKKDDLLEVKYIVDGIEYSYSLLEEIERLNKLRMFYN